MWPFSEIDNLKTEIRILKSRNEYLESLQLSEKDKQELEFLRSEIGSYVTYAYGLDRERSSWYPRYRYHETRTLTAAESDLTKARFYISVLEAQLGKDGIEAAKNVCQRLQELCASRKEISGDSNDGSK